MTDTPGVPNDKETMETTTHDKYISAEEAASVPPLMEPIILPRRPKSLQILSLAIYNRSGERRELKFHLGRVNIVTGASLTGKSALISIVDYCLGRIEFIIPAGVITDTVAWYVLHILLPNGEAIIGRQPPSGAITTSTAYLQMGTDLSLPEFADLRVNSNTSAVSDLLTEAVGITANENIPLEGQSRRPLQANIGHARFVLFQPQTVIANDKTLFYRSDEQFIPQSIKDTLPYFLGATGDDQYERLQQVRRLRRELRLLERRHADEQAVRGRENTKASSLLSEAENAGLLSLGDRPAELSGSVDVLRTLVTWTPAQDETPQGIKATALQDERELLLEASRIAQREIDAARSFVAAQEGFNVEASDQKNRLSSINLYRNETTGQCPLCEHELSTNVPRAEAIRSSLDDLERQMAGTTRQRPRLEAFVEERENSLTELRRQLRENKSSVEALMVQEEALQRNRDRVVSQAKLIGRIIEFVDTVRIADDDSGLLGQIQSLRSKVADLEEGLSEGITDDRLNSILQVIARDMSVWARQLSLEHSEWPVGLDLNARNPTVIAHRPTGPIRMFQMGGGKNWMGYHIVTHLALQKLFRDRTRPVPGLLMLDQPPQVYYPPEKVADRSISDLGDEDRQAVQRLFELIFNVTKELTPDLQIIITDHADLDAPWFQEAVIARWRNGEKLVPTNWIAITSPRVDTDTEGSTT